MRYFAQAWVELLDERAGLAATGLLSLSPPGVLSRCVALSYAAHRGRRDAPSYPVIYDLAHTSLRVIEQSRNIVRWWPQEAQEARRRLSEALLLQPGKSSRRHRAWFQERSWAAVRRGVKPLLARMDDERDGYRARMVELVTDRCGRTLTTYGDWESFDLDIRQLVALLRDEGRSGDVLAMSVVRTINDADDAAAATAALRALLNETGARYEIALAVTGARDVFDLRTAFGCRVIGANASWSLSAGPGAKRALDAYVNGHASTQRAVIGTVIEAWDVAHALEGANEVAERLLAQLGARHRTYEFSCIDTPLVLREGKGIQVVASRTRTSLKAQLLFEQPDVSLDEPVQLLRLARQARLPVLTALQCWMALEALAADMTAPESPVDGRKRGSSPYDILSLKLPRIVALHSVRLALTDLWSLASLAARRNGRGEDWKRIETWLGTDARNRLRDPNAWFDLLLVAPGAGPAPRGPLTNAEDAARLLEELRPALGPFVARKLWLWRGRLSDNLLLGRWALRLETDTAGHLNHLYAVRNAAVHNGVIGDPRQRAIADVSSLLLDITLEMLASWRASSPLRPGGRGLDMLHVRANRILRKWNGPVRRTVDIDLARLTLPGGDGLSRRS